VRSVLSGTFTDTTAAVKAYLLAGNTFRLANLYLIGPFEDPQSLWLTDWESPLLWPPWGSPFSSPAGQFQPAVITRGPVKSAIGLQVDPLTITWSPLTAPFTQSIDTASPYQRAQLGYYDNAFFRSWSVYMPTAGDCMTYGASQLFGGRIADTVIERVKIPFTVNSFLDVVNEKIPTNVIEMTNGLAGFKGATPPAGLSQVPQFNVITGSTPTSIIGDATSPNAHQIFATNALRGGFLVFNGGAGATLTRFYSAIAENQQFTVGLTHYNQIVLYTPLPWAPTPGTDTFYVSRAFPVSAVTTPWAVGTYAQNDEILDPSGYVQVATTPGTTGGTIPSFSSTPGNTTSDGSVVWTNYGLQSQYMYDFRYVPAPEQSL
jgi:hypothetical protein